MNDRLSRTVTSVIFWMGAVLSLAGGIAVATILAVDPQAPYLDRVLRATVATSAAFGVAGLFVLVLRLTEALGGRRPAPAPLPLPIPVPEAAATVEKPAETPVATGASAELFSQMKTYVDLEMWDLALEKANTILKSHGGSPEAMLVEKNIYELSWKAEPKFMEKTAPKDLTPAQKRLMHEKGVAQMLHHLKTYIDLEMWDLAREKATHLLKEYGDSPEAAEAAKLVQKIPERTAAPAGPRKD